MSSITETERRKWFSHPSDRTGLEQQACSHSGGGGVAPGGLISSLLAMLYVADHRSSPAVLCFHKTFPVAPQRRGWGVSGGRCAEKYQKFCGLRRAGANQRRAPNIL